jgi:alcohol dehydrogenase (cytochrome c)
MTAYAVARQQSSLAPASPLGFLLLFVLLPPVEPRAAGAQEGARPIDWPYYNRTLTAERHAPLTQIDRQNVSGLRQVCAYDLGIDTSFQTGPIVIGSTLYGTTEKETFAIDAVTCAESWRVAEQVADSYLKVNRGVAHLDGRLYRGLHDGRVVAYDAKTGRKVWEVRIANAAEGESVPAAPRAWNGTVFIGQAGGDNKGVKGRMYALDAATGKQIWETYLVPKDEGERKQPATKMASVAAPSWKNPANVPITGGATWTTYTLDAERGLLYVPGGNPAPDFVPSMRPGANLFANSVVVLDAKTGEYRRHFSLVPEDFHDWDVASARRSMPRRARRCGTPRSTVPRAAASSRTRRLGSSGSRSSPEPTLRSGRWRRRRRRS